MFKYTVQEDSSQERWVVQGRLAGAFAYDLGVKWEESVERTPLRPRVVDLREVVIIDKCGQELLRKMLSQQAEFIVSGLYTKFLLQQLRFDTEARTKNQSS